MKSCEIVSSLSSQFNDEEIEVCEILLKLPQLFFESESGWRLPMSWAVKRRRSAIDSSSSPRLRPSLFKKPMSKMQSSSSPATPLSFSPSEPDEKPKNYLRKIYKKKEKRSKEELVLVVSDLNQQGRLLRMKLEEKRVHFNKLKAVNSKLKARKEELSQGFNLNLEIQLAQPTIQSQDQSAQPGNHQWSMPPLIVNQTVQRLETCQNIQFQYRVGEGKVNNHVGHVNLPDLNLTLQETNCAGLYSFQPSDMMICSRSVAKLARQKRKQITMEKNGGRKLRI